MGPNTDRSAWTVSVDEDVLRKYNISYKEWEIFRDFQVKQNEFHEWLKSMKLTPEETKAIDCRSYDQCVDFWTSYADKAQLKFEKQHQKGVKRWARKYQGLGSGISRFMQDINPLLDIVKGLGPPYTGIAIGTISGLFMIAGRKNAVEEQAWAALESVKDRLPGFQMYEEIYREETILHKDLRKKIIFVYMEFINMSMEISRYYLQPGYGRWGVAIFKSDKFKDMTDNVNKSIISIRMRCEELQSVSINKLRESNIALIAKLEKIERDSSSNLLIDLQALLGLPKWTPQAHKDDLDHYLDHINSERDREVMLEQMRTGSMERFRREQEYMDWDCAGKPAMLILVGVNHSAIAYGKQHCWVSPFAIELGERLFQTASMPYAIYVFPPRKSTSIYAAIPVVLVQLLTHLNTKLHGNEQRNSLWAAAEAYTVLKAPEDDDEVFYSGEKIDALTSLASAVIQLFEPAETVSIILDRVDQCLGRDHFDLLRIMTEIICKARCVVKVLMVADGVAWEDALIKSFRHKLPNSSDPKLKVLKQERIRKNLGVGD